MKKLKTQQEILEWFGNSKKSVSEVLIVTDNRIFFRLYRTEKLFIFDNDTKLYEVNKDVI